MIVQRSDGRLVFVRPAIIDRATPRKISAREGALSPPPPPRTMGGGHSRIFSRKTLKGILG